MGVGNWTRIHALRYLIPGHSLSFHHPVVLGITSFLLAFGDTHIYFIYIIPFHTLYFMLALHLTHIFS